MIPKPLLTEILKTSTPILDYQFINNGNSILYYDMSGDLTSKELMYITNNIKKLFELISYKKSYNTCYGKVYPLDLQNLKYEKDLISEIFKGK